MVDNQPAACTATGRPTGHHYPGRRLCPSPLGLECSGTVDAGGFNSIAILRGCLKPGLGLERTCFMRLDGVALPTGSDGPPPIPGLCRVAWGLPVGGER